MEMDLSHQVSLEGIFMHDEHLQYSVPIGVFAAGLLMLAMPTRLPREPSSLAAERTPWYRNLRKLDYPGVFALIGASVLLTAALQQAAKGVPFSAPSVVALLALALVFLVAFILWQWLATKRSAKVTAQPILSWDLLSDRIFLGVLL
jgi:NhaP-type Na+/H+ or K+/H+ antiporter